MGRVVPSISELSARDGQTLKCHPQEHMTVCSVCATGQILPNPRWEPPHMAVNERNGHPDPTVTRGYQESLTLEEIAWYIGITSDKTVLWEINSGEGKVMSIREAFNGTEKMRVMCSETETPLAASPVRTHLKYNIVHFGLTHQQEHLDLSPTPAQDKIKKMLIRELTDCWTGTIP